MEKQPRDSGLPAFREEESPLVRFSQRATAFLKGYAGREAIPGVLMFFAAWLFAKTPLLFGAYPLGLGLLCGERRHQLPTMLGLAVGCVSLGVPGVVWGILYILAFLFRLLFSTPGSRLKSLPSTKGVFWELPQLQITTAVLVGAVAGLYECFVSGFVTNSLLFGLVMVVGAGGIAALLSGFFSWDVTWEEVLGKKGVKPARRSRGERAVMEVGLCLFLGLIAFCLKDISLFGVSLGYLVTAFATLFTARRFGAMRGCALGLVVGLFTGVYNAPAFGLMGLATGGLWTLGAVYSLCIGGACAVAFAAFTGGLSGFLELAPEIAVAVLLAAPLLPRLYSDAIATEVRQDKQGAEEAVRGVLAKEETGVELGRLSKAFRTLAGAFAEPDLSPDPGDAFCMCDRAFTAHCFQCERRSVCWDSDEHPAVMALTVLTEDVTRGNPIAGDKLPTAMVTECKHLDTILGDIRRGSGALWQERREKAGADYPAPDYSLMAELLEDVAKNRRKEEKVDLATAGAIRRILGDRGLLPAAVFVRGEREKRIVIGSGEFGAKQKEAAASVNAMEELLGCKLSPPKFDATGEVMTMETHTAKQFGLEVAYARRPAKNSEVSGDAVGLFHGPDGHSYLMLSDGMGTGERAAHAATTACIFLDKMLSGGATEETALKMLNRLIGVKEGECPCTVDLLKFDCYLGSACFLKSGAAASYVRRDGNLFRLRSKTIPVGAVKELDAERLRFDTKAGDVIIMVSDGVSQTSEDAPWLMELLSKPLGQNLQNAVNTILEEAMRKTESKDDMTVAIARVCEVAKEKEMGA